MNFEEPTGERRRWRRLKSELRLRLQVIGPEGGGRVLEAIGTHFNPAGIFVALADPPPVGARVQVTLAADGPGGVLSSEGEVVSRRVLDQESNQRPGCGVRLLHAGPVWRKLYDWLLDEQPSEPTESPHSS